ncbi:tripartite tricarboxylate transporter TctB family protein [Lonepinella koalarum]|uniref:Putative tricarboxylic transport membrane protein n=1 Tax=Lonepinella koalarum TaxID=53417 RepID=A0A4R1KYQ6_9PAST|nr:tripartite tricarboxylate transporter TctB family protein [Lonepinella koalarum]MDH2926693.1 tricarboxylate transporter [Lonepinella koalarum]TCK70646.1 putative tricarboxylic transport membrane protein [Lonepinella koalarum]TFJ89974.1 tripartite tricarboxylate transporter TctB family protein [Lonepinella koalarum]
MKIQFRQDLVGSTVFLIVSVVIWYLIPSQIVLTHDEPINSQTFPRLIIGLMGLCSLILLIKELIKWGRKQPVKMVELHFKQESRSAMVLLLLALYWGLMHWVPFAIASIIFSSLMLLSFGCRNWRYYAIVAAVILIISVLFEYVLKVSLP